MGEVPKGKSNLPPKEVRPANLAELMGLIGLRKGWDFFISALSNTAQVHDLFKNTDSDGEGRRSDGSSRRMQLGYDWITYQNLNSLLNDVMAAEAKGRTVGASEGIIKLFLVQKSDDVGSVNRLKKWLVRSSKYGLVLPREKSQIPQLGQMRQKVGREFTLGHAIHTFITEVDHKKADSPLSHEQYEFLIGCLLEALTKDRLEVLDFFQFAVSQHANGIEHDMKFDPMPEWLVILGGAKDKEAWKESLKISTFMLSFMRTLHESLSDSDHESHEVSAKFLTALIEDEKQHRPRAISPSTQIAYYLYINDAVVRQNELISFIQSIRAMYEDEDEIPEWVTDLYEKSMEFVGRDGGMLGMTKFWGKLIDLNTPREYVRDDQLRESIEYGIQYLENSDTYFSIDQSDLNALSISFENLGISNKDGYEPSLIIMPKSESLLLVQISNFGEELAYLRITIDFGTDPIQFHLSVIDERDAHNKPEIESAIRYTLYRFFSELYLWEEKLKHATASENEAEQEKKKEVQLVTITPDHVKKYPFVTAADEPAQEKERKKRQKPAKDAGHASVDARQAPLGMKESDVDAFFARRFAQPLDLLDESVWDKTIEDHTKEDIRRKIALFNAALSGESRQIRFAGKLFKKKYLRNGHRIWQIRSGDYRILAEVGNGAGAHATIFAICHKANIERYVAGYKG